MGDGLGGNIHGGNGEAEHGAEPGNVVIHGLVGRVHFGCYTELTGCHTGAGSVVDVGMGEPERHDFQLFLFGDAQEGAAIVGGVDENGLAGFGVVNQGAVALELARGAGNSLIHIVNVAVAVRPVGVGIAILQGMKVISVLSLVALWAVGGWAGSDCELKVAGWLAPGVSADSLRSRLGRADEGPVQFMAQDSLFYWRWSYRDLGLSVPLVSTSSKGPWRVGSGMVLVHPAIMEVAGLQIGNTKAAAQAVLKNCSGYTDLGDSAKVATPDLSLWLDWSNGLVRRMRLDRTP